MRSLSKLAAISVIGAMSAFVAGSAAASTWMYNGSKVSLEGDGAKRRIVFTEPKLGLDKAGIKRGTVLFEGETKKNGRLSGYAKLFKAGCDPLDYFVEGSADSSKGEIVLQGQAPVFSNDGCKIKGYSEDSAASTLTFSSLGSGGRGNYADRGYEQGDGSYGSNGGGRNTQADPRYGQSNDDRNSSGNGQRDDYASNSNERYGNSQSSGSTQYGNRQGSAGSQYDNRDSGRYDDQRNGARSSQSQDGPDDRYDNRDPRSRDYVERGSARTDGEEYDPRYDRADPGDDPENDYVEERSYRYRTWRRPYYPDWRDGTGR